MWVWVENGKDLRWCYVNLNRERTEREGGEGGRAAVHNNGTLFRSEQ